MSAAIKVQHEIGRPMLGELYRHIESGRQLIPMANSGADIVCRPVRGSTPGPLVYPVAEFMEFFSVA
ncbi:MAG: hypothetical protein OEW37_07800 [Rhodospirillaceae bacterium]|nr:hypothetical protein [Rhodospirillaceae bacterium]